MKREARMIYEGRLAVSKAELIEFLDNGLRRWSIKDHFRGLPAPPETIPFADRYIQKYGEHRATYQQIAEITKGFMSQLHPQRVYLQTFWRDDSQVTCGWYYLNSDGGLCEFNDGEIELLPSVSKKNGFTNIVIRSHYPARRAHWEWVAKRMRMQFRELRKGGPKATPLDEKIKIVGEWRSRQGKELKENYCSRKGISVSTLRHWEHEIAAPSE